MARTSSRGGCRRASGRPEQAVKTVAARAERVARRIYRNGVEALRDRRLGVRTSDEIELADLAVDGPDRRPYAPSRWSALEKILPRAEVEAEDVFLDLGAGMGRVVLAAASYPFARVWGVEMSPDLCRIARTNVDCFRGHLACPDIRIVESDVLDFAIPDDASVVFLYNPFGGQVFSAVVRALIESYDRAPRRVRIIYRNPAEEAALLATGRVVPIRTVMEFQLSLNLRRWRSLRMYELRPAAEVRSPVQGCDASPVPLSAGTVSRVDQVQR